MDLSGQWKASVVNPEINKVGTDIAFDDSTWQKLAVPGRWSANKHFATNKDPVLYRRTFEHTPKTDERTWLLVEGVMSQSEIWLNGQYLGETNGYFVPYQFDITELLKETRSPHTIALQVSCSPQGFQRGKRSFTGSFQAHTPNAPISDGGIWKNIRLHTTKRVAIQHTRLLCTKATQTEAELSIRTVLNCQQAETATIKTTIKEPQGTILSETNQNHTLSSGENHITWNIPVQEPELWWTAALGKQPLYEVQIEVQQDNGEPSDTKSWKTGLRQIRMKNFLWTLNGEKIFLKAIAADPKQLRSENQQEDLYRKDIEKVKESGLNMLRVHGHISSQQTYEAADQLGVLLWQDLPLLGGYATSARKPAKAIARAAVDLLGHHPSVAVWCCHLEPNDSAIPRPSEETKPFSRFYKQAKHVLPSWNRTILSPTIKKEVKSADKSRPIIEASGNIPTPTSFERSDANLWLGWRTGTWKDLAKIAKKWPRLTEFLGGIGSQSVTVKNWDSTEPTWEAAETESFSRYIPRSTYKSGTRWAYATRQYQAQLIKFHIETLRKIKYNPSGGFCIYTLTDNQQEGGFGVCEQSGKIKPAYEALTTACQPILPVADYLPETIQAGENISLNLYVINDLPEAVQEMTIQATITAREWSTTRYWKGGIEADTSIKVGTCTFAVPPELGELSIELTLTGQGKHAKNYYSSEIIAG